MDGMSMRPAWRRALDKFADGWGRPADDPFSGQVTPLEIEEFALLVEAEVRADIDAALGEAFRSATARLREGVLHGSGEVES